MRNQVVTLLLLCLYGSYKFRTAEAKENVFTEGPRRPSTLSRCVSCAAGLNGALVAPLFHYLIGKRVSTPRWVSTPLCSAQMEKGLPWRSAFRGDFLYFFSFLLICSSSLLVWTFSWNRKSYCLKLMFSTCSHTLHLLPVSSFSNPNSITNVEHFSLFSHYELSPHLKKERLRYHSKLQFCF